ncbi:MAG: hypothetical protein D6832_05580 [Alphaproteobacteria bacterium]|nr:MAG: hypothetical protein D6832_05580 [Alphaproteobacteria bacterium]
MHELIEPHPAEAPAIIDHDGRALSYGELRALGADLAERLAAEGLRPGDRLMVVSENCALYAGALMAASRLDAWFMPVNARHSPDELARLAAHSGARLILFTTAASPDAAAHAARMGAREAGHTAAGPLVLAGPVTDVAPEPVEPGRDQTAALMYTTGTTSDPKGVMLSHGNLVFNAVNTATVAGVGPQDRALAVLPGTHIYCLGSVFLTCMAGGASVVFEPRFDVERVLAHLAAGVTRFPGVPQMFAAILAHLDRSGARLEAPRLTHIGAGDAPLDPALKTRIEQVFGLPLNNGYGLTETAPTVAGTRNDEPRADNAVGRPLPGIEVRIDRPDEEGIGEILIRGPNVMKGYYRDPERTAAAFTEDGFFRTGDLGRFGEDGALYVAGRLKELIIRSGFNVYPPEIEDWLTRHPDVYQAAVVGRQVPGNEEILAFVRTGGRVSEDEFKAFLREHLAPYKVPQHIFIVEDWPTAATGKILKHRLIGHFADLIAARDRAAGRG